jgi:hypothetical protein
MRNVSVGRRGWGRNVFGDCQGMEINKNLIFKISCKKFSKKFSKFFKTKNNFFLQILIFYSALSFPTLSLIVIYTVFLFSGIISVSRALSKSKWKKNLLS